jgi:hypothetical protein
MFTVRDLLTSIVKSQSGVPARYIYKVLDDVYNQLKPGIKIPKAEIIDNGTLIYIKVPSEDGKNEYDVDFWFDTQKVLMNNAKFKVYTNSPHFAYRYAFVFNKNGSLLWQKKYPSIMINTPPKASNPEGSIGFDKHVYSALKHIFKSSLYKFVQSSDPKVKVAVMDFEDKMSSLKK